MSRLAGFSGKAATAKFVQLGYVVVRQRGSHVRLKHPLIHRRPLTIPLHQELKVGLLHSLLKQASITAESFLKL